MKKTTIYLSSTAAISVKHSSRFISAHNFHWKLQHAILRRMRKWKHVTEEEDPSYFFRRKSDSTANKITPADFIYTGDLVCQWNVLAQHAAQSDLISIQWNGRHCWNATSHVPGTWWARMETPFSFVVLTTKYAYSSLAVWNFHLIFDCSFSLQKVSRSPRTVHRSQL